MPDFNGSKNVMVMLLSSTRLQVAGKTLYSYRSQTLNREWTIPLFFKPFMLIFLIFLESLKHLCQTNLGGFCTSQPQLPTSSPSC